MVPSGGHDDEVPGLCPLEPARGDYQRNERAGNSHKNDKTTKAPSKKNKRVDIRRVHVGSVKTPPFQVTLEPCIEEYKVCDGESAEKEALKKKSGNPLANHLHINPTFKQPKDRSRKVHADINNNDDEVTKNEHEQQPARCTRIPTCEHETQGTCPLDSAQGDYGHTDSRTKSDKKKHESKKKKATVIRIQVGAPKTPPLQDAMKNAMKTYIEPKPGKHTEKTVEHMDNAGNGTDKAVKEDSKKSRKSIESHLHINPTFKQPKDRASKVDGVTNKVDENDLEEECRQNKKEVEKTGPECGKSRANGASERHIKLTLKKYKEQVTKVDCEKTKVDEKDPDEDEVEIQASEFGVIETVAIENESDGVKTKGGVKKTNVITTVANKLRELKTKKRRDSPVAKRNNWTGSELTKARTPTPPLELVDANQHAPSPPNFKQSAMRNNWTQKQLTCDPIPAYKNSNKNASCSSSDVVSKIPVVEVQLNNWTDIPSPTLSAASLNFNSSPQAADGRNLDLALQLPDEDDDGGDNRSDLSDDSEFEDGPFTDGSQYVSSSSNDDEEEGETIIFVADDDNDDDNNARANNDLDHVERRRALNKIFDDQSSYGESDVDEDTDMLNLRIRRESTYTDKIGEDSDTKKSIKRSLNPEPKRTETNDRSKAQALSTTHSGIGSKPEENALPGSTENHGENEPQGNALPGSSEVRESQGKSLCTANPLASEFQGKVYEQLNATAKYIHEKKKSVSKLHEATSQPYGHDTSYGTRPYVGTCPYTQDTYSELENDIRTYEKAQRRLQSPFKKKNSKDTPGIPEYVQNTEGKINYLKDKIAELKAAKEATTYVGCKALTQGTAFSSARKRRFGKMFTFLGMEDRSFAGGVPDYAQAKCSAEDSKPVHKPDEFVHERDVGDVIRRARETLEFYVEKEKEIAAKYSDIKRGIQSHREERRRLKNGLFGKDLLGVHIPKAFMTTREKLVYLKVHEKKLRAEKKAVRQRRDAVIQEQNIMQKHLKKIQAINNKCSLRGSTRIRGSQLSSKLY